MQNPFGAEIEHDTHFPYYPAANLSQPNIPICFTVKYLWSCDLNCKSLLNFWNKEKKKKKKNKNKNYTEGAISYCANNYDKFPLA